MTHDELVEKVARAIYIERRKPSSKFFDDLDYTKKVALWEQSRAAIAVVNEAQRQATADIIAWIETLPREPTPALRKAFAEYQAIVGADASPLAQRGSE